MAISPDLLEKLACPKCRGPLRLKQDEPALTCAACGLLYAITNDIPNLIVSEAKALAAG